MLPIPFRSAKKIASLIRRKKVGCREMLDIYLRRLEQYNPKINAVICLDVKAARKRAKAADEALAEGQIWGPLHGVPVTLKESFDVKGMPTTRGNPIFKDNFPKKNAIIADRLLNAGAVIFGKTNVPLNLADWQTYNEIHGTTNNPWDLTRSPGGSSGGSAAALAAGLTALEAGSDIGASIRNPAHYCGVYGHKPTYGIITPVGHSVPGMVAVGDITAVGPLARSAEDLALALDVMAGPDDIDGAGWQLRLPKPKKKYLRDYKVAVIYSDPVSEVDNTVQKRIRAVADFLRKSKAKVSERARPKIDMQTARTNFNRLVRSATVGRLSPEEFNRNVEKARKIDPNDEAYQAQMILAQVMHHKDWLIYNEERHKMRLAWAEFFRDYDVLLCPIAATTAITHNHEGERWERMVMVNGNPQPSTTQVFWAGYSGQAYLPSTVAPAGLASDGLPVGVLIVGPQYGDHTCIHFAGLLEKEFQGFIAPEGFK